MLKIDISDFNLKEFCEEITYGNDIWQVNLSDHMHEGGYSIVISINGKYILNDPLKRPNTPLQGYVIYHTLKSINNAFYQLLTGSSEATIVVDSGSSHNQLIKLRKNDGNVLFTTVRGYCEFDCDLDEEPVNFIQACEEVIRAVRDYKKICMEAAKKVAPNDAEKFMDELFGEKKSAKIRKNSLDWMSAEDRLIGRDYAARWQMLEEAWVKKRV